MSTFFGFTCLRSSPGLAGSLRAQAAVARATSLVGAARCLSTWSRSRRLKAEQSNGPSGYIIHRQWTLHAVHSPVQKRTLFGRKSSPAYAHYLDLPPDYKDEVGLPFQKAEELDLPATVAIFPGFADMTPYRANKLLKIMHGRRVAGTLDDPSLRINTATFTQREIDQALHYLRSEFPVDEVLNAGLRAEDELRDLEAGITSDVDGSEEPPAAETGEAAVEKKDANPRSPYGQGVLDKIRASNIARREAQERAEAEQRRREEEAEAQNWGGLAAYDPALHRGLHPKQLEHFEAASSGLEAPPDTPRWRVLLPTTVFTAAVLAALYLLVDKVAPPRPGAVVEAAGYPGITEAHLTVGAIVLLNVAVFIAWRRVRLWKYLNRHFILDFVTPRPHQILTAIATHQDPRHLLKAMFLAFAGGSLLIDEVGPVPFLATYLASGMCGFLATMYTHVMRGQLIYMFGASSAGFGVICAYFWLYRFDGFKILGLPPDPYEGVQGLGFIGLVMAFFAFVPLVRGQGGGVDWMSHLVGMLTGIGCASLMEGRWKKAKAEKTLEQAELLPVKEDRKTPNGVTKGGK